MAPEESLFELSTNYARAADRRDEAAFCGVFGSEGELHLYGSQDSDAPARTLRGHDELATVVEKLARFDRTYHMLGQAGYEVAGDSATGEVYCIAHHLSLDSTTAWNRVLYIRYADNYRRDSGGRWQIELRAVQVDWTETRSADHPSAWH